MVKVSVVLPAHNAEPSIAAAIESIRAQTAKDWELVVVDDGSADRTHHAATTAAQGDPRIRIVSQPHAGIVAALTRGMDAAGGEFIARMDADDVAHPERLQRQLDFFERQPDLGVVGCQVNYGGSREESLGYALHVEWTNTLITPAEIALNRFVESPLVHPSVMFRRSLIERHGGYADGDFPEDYELWLRWLDAGVGMAKVAQPLLTWNDSGHRLSRTDSRYSPEAFFRLKAKWLAAHLQRAGVAPAREIWLWGAGRPTRKRASHLESHRIALAGYIDVDAKKIGGRIAGRPVLGPDHVPDPQVAFILGYVSSRGARELIRKALVSRGYVEGENFMMCA